MGNDLAFALQVLVLGFTVVLITLVTLFFLLIVFNRIFYKKEKPAKSEGLAVPAASSAPAEKAPEAVIAAAMGAVYAYMEDMGVAYSPGRFAISVQQAGGGSANNWVINGRKRLQSGRIVLEQIRRNKQRENI